MSEEKDSQNEKVIISLINKLEDFIKKLSANETIAVVNSFSLILGMIFYVLPNDNKIEITEGLALFTTIIIIGFILTTRE